MRLLQPFHGRRRRPASKTARVAAGLLALGGSLPLALGADDAQHLQALLPGEPDGDRAAAFEHARTAGDPRYLPPLVDLLRMADTPEEWFRILDAVGGILGEDVRSLERPWRNLTLRLAEDDEQAFLPGYAAWKGELLARLVDPRFRQFLNADVASRVRLDEVVWGGVGVDGIPALHQAPTIRGQDATYLDANEPVFGVALGGEARAYPLRILDWHEMANDVVSGVAVALAYCTLCGSGVLYETQVGERTFHFGSSGLLMRSNKLMYDRETHSLWNQLSGEPVVGELATSGIQLKVRSLVLTSWGEWLSRHPETSVLDPDTGFDREYRLGAGYGSYFASPETMFPAYRRQPATSGDGLDPAKERLYVVRVDGHAEAFEVETLARAGLHHARVGEQTIVLIHAGGAGDMMLKAETLSALGRDGSRPALASELSLEDLQRVWKAHPDQIDAELLLAVGTRVRLAFLAWAESPTDPSTPRLPSLLRDEVALRGLIGDVRAYESGGRTFTHERGASHVTDADGKRWEVREDQLVDDEGNSLARVPGHLIYRFGWEAFLSGTPVHR